MTTSFVKSFYRSVDLVNSIIKRITISELIKKKDRVLLSISGGQDSICLLFVLNQLSDQMELHLALFWCHHLWQIDSFSIMRQIAKVSFLFQFGNCFAIPSNFIPSELLARNWRHNSSYRICLFYNYSKIALAHSANDKIETVFLNLMRGTGLTGLAPLRWTQNISKKYNPSNPSNPRNPPSEEGYGGKANIQDHVSQFPRFLVSPFFWSSSYNPSNSSLRNSSPLGGTASVGGVSEPLADKKVWGSRRGSHIWLECTNKPTGNTNRRQFFPKDLPIATPPRFLFFRKKSYFITIPHKEGSTITGKAHTNKITPWARNKNKILGNTEKKTKATKWFCCVSYTFLKTCSTNL